MPTAEEFVAAATDAASAWGLAPRSVELLSHSENVVCVLHGVTGDAGDDGVNGSGGPGGDRLIMRLHRPGYNTVDELDSEVAWVAALRSAGLPVPTPRPSVDGAYYVPVAIGDEVRQVGVVEWVDGEPLGGPVTPGEGQDLLVHYERIGEIAAAIRVHHRTWRPPARFVRRRWDHDGLVGPAPLWGRFWEVDRLTAQQRALFVAARRELGRRLDDLGVDDQRFGLIHADLHQGNVMADGDHLTIIDFDDAGFGWFAHDLAVALHPVLEEPPFAAARRALVSGYRRVHRLDDEEEGLIDTFLTIRCLMIVGWLDQRSELPVHRHFDELIAQAERVATRFLDTGRV